MVEPVPGGANRFCLNFVVDAMTGVEAIMDLSLLKLFIFNINVWFVLNLWLLSTIGILLT